jgi:hypothetical protein
MSLPIHRKVHYTAGSVTAAAARAARRTTPSYRYRLQETGRTVFFPTWPDSGNTGTAADLRCN